MFEENPLVFQHVSVPLHKSQIHDKMVFLIFFPPKLDCNTLNPDLSLVQHIWDELEHLLHARSYLRHQCLNGSKSLQPGSKLLWETFPEERRLS